MFTDDWRTDFLKTIDSGNITDNNKSWDNRIANISLNFYDNGGGVAENIIDKIFEPYFTTKDDTGGTGVGLHMAKEIIEKQFNGKLSVTNEYFTIKNNKHFGACFHIKVPKNKT